MGSPGHPAAPVWRGYLLANGLATDTPGHLRNLSSNQAEQVNDAFDHLWYSVMHQGSIWTATGPAILEVIAELKAGRLAGDPRGGDPAARERDAIEFIADALRSTHRAPANLAPVPADRLKIVRDAIAAYDRTTFWEQREVVGDVMTQAILGVRATAEAARDCARRYLNDVRPSIRAQTIDLFTQATLSIGRHTDNERAIDVLAPSLAAADDRVRATAAYTTGQLGGDPSAALQDPALVVRVAAALAPGMQTKQAAKAVLLNAASDFGALKQAFRKDVPAISGSIRSAVIRAAVVGVETFDELLPAALSCLEHSSIMSFNDWGAFLVAAHELHPNEMTPAAAAYLTALVTRDDLWDTKNGSAGLQFRRAGLPYDRSACAALLRDQHRD